MDEIHSGGQTESGGGLEDLPADQCAASLDSVPVENAKRGERQPDGSEF
jgi:hypothetical protein